MAQDPSTTPPDQLGPPWTILKILRWTTHFFQTRQVTDSARLDAELLLCDVLGFERVKLYTHFDRPMSSDELSAFRALIKRRAQGEPVAYILGSRGFWSFDLKVDPRALIPRPDTEVLVEEALRFIPDGQDWRVLDVGTGSGAVALALASERPDIRVLATDISADALALAQENVDALGLAGRVELAQSDLLAEVDPATFPYQMIVSNPPYIGEEERAGLMSDVRDFEPAQALFAGQDGLAVYRRLIPAAFDALQGGGHLLLEIGSEQGAAVEKLLADAGFIEVALRKDYADLDRVAHGKKPD